MLHPYTTLKQNQSPSENYGPREWIYATYKKNVLYQDNDMVVEKTKQREQIISTYNVDLGKMFEF